MWKSPVAIPIALLFLISGFIINGFQALSMILLLFSRQACRRANIFLVDKLWSELVWLLDWWAGVDLKLYAEPGTLEHMGKEHALLICNHRSDIDWLVGWTLAERSGCLGGTRAIMKRSVKYLPVIGWSMYFADYVFLARNWSKDEQILKDGYRSLKSFPVPFWLALFVEGTRFTQTKLEAAQEYAASVGMPIPRNVLIPRTKGFVSAITNLRDFVPAIYDMTLAVSKDAPQPNVSRLLQGKASVVHLLIKRVPMTELPATDEGIAAWCREAFVRKDAVLDEHNKHNSFGEEKRLDFPRSWTPLAIVIGWALFVFTLSVYVLRNVLSTWNGILWFVGGLSLVAILQYVLIQASQADRSKGPRVNSRPKSKQAEKETEQNIVKEEISENHSLDGIKEGSENIALEDKKEQ